MTYREPEAQEPTQLEKDEAYVRDLNVYVSKNWQTAFYSVVIDLLLILARTLFLLVRELRALSSRSEEP